MNLLQKDLNLKQLIKSTFRCFLVRGKSQGKLVEFEGFTGFYGAYLYDIASLKFITSDFLF